jgi:DNA-binding response OmpR family regulator
MLGRVLIVEDNAEVARLVQAFLTAQGVDHTWCADGPAALATFTDQFQAVILDVAMPGMSGLEVASALRARPDGQQCVIVGYSGFGREVDRARALAAGMDDYFVKTTLITQVLARIKLLVALRHTELPDRVRAAAADWHSEQQYAASVREQARDAKDAFARARSKWAAELGTTHAAFKLRFLPAHLMHQKT